MNFRVKTILGIALIESVLLLILVISSLDFLSTSNEEQLTQSAATTVKLFASATKNAVLATDLATLENFVEAILTNPQIVYVRITGPNQLLAEGGPSEFLTTRRSPDSSLASVSDDVYDVVARIEEAGIIYGIIELGISTKSIQTVFAEARQWAISIALLEIILVAIFSWILGTYLTRYLLKLQAASKEIAESGPGIQLKVTGQDEIADVTRAFNTMSMSLQKTYSEQKGGLASQEQILAKLERNSAKNQAILSTTLDANITIDQSGKVIDYNDAAEYIFGWRLDEIVGKDMADHIIPLKLRELHNRGMQNYLATGEGPLLGKRIQMQAQHKSGRQFPVELAINPIDTQNGKIFTAFLRDISKELENETEMRLIGRAFQTSEAMFITNTHASIIRVNEAFTRNSGYQEDEVLGKKPSLWASGQYDGDFYREMWVTLLETGEWKGEILNRRKNGEIIAEYLNISAVRDKDGDITHYVAHLIDISEQKANEKQLLDAIQKARQADEAKNRFLAVMSHEIRTPMNAVLGVLGLLRDTPLDEAQQNLIQTGRESGEMLLLIINDILDFSKMEANKLELESTNFDLHRLLNQSMELLKTRAQQNSLEMSVILADNLPRFSHGDPSRLQQILVNLINNACKFTTNGSITLHASATLFSDSRFKLYCEVEDTGIGIPTNRQDELFEEFSMIDQSHSRAYEGTGLGLAICKRLVSLMGGEISVNSLPGLGSRFCFHVIMKVAEDGYIEQAQELKPIEFPSPDTRILVAEDNPANQRVIRSILQSAGLQVDLVSNGQEAVEAVAKLPYDIVLMDISMPQMDGMEATRAIRKIDGINNQVPIVALTAHALKGDRERFIASGMNDYLTKPIDKSATLRCIHLWTSDRSDQKIQTDNQRTGPAPLKSDDDQITYVNEAVLQQLVRDTSADIVPELLRGYIDDTQERLRQIKIAVSRTDAGTLELEVHSLGSSAGSHSNTALLELSRHIESLCRQGDSESAMQQVPKLIELAEESLRLLAQRNEMGFES
ncbi:MAG: PAS domain S-box-containing protein [Gammaproteobacteria bacterium]